MSSDYRVLCMSHDPAIVIDHEWPEAAAAIAAVRDRIPGEPLADHMHCDLLVGRYSAALVEVCCPGGEHAEGRIRMHVNARWIDVDWLGLLHRAYASDDASVRDAAGSLSDCWTAARVARLRSQVGGMTSCG